MSIRALYVIPEYPPDYGGGIATYYAALLPELVREGICIDVIVGSGCTGQFPGRQENGITIRSIPNDLKVQYRERLPQFSLIPDLQSLLAAAWAAYDIAQSGKGYDYVESTDWGLLSIPWLLSTDCPPFLLRLHGSCGQIALNEPADDRLCFAAFAQLIEKAVFPLADRLSTSSTINSLWWKQQLGLGVNLIPPPLHPPFSKKQSTKEYALVVGRVQPWKGPDVLCQAISLLDNCIPIEWYGRSVPDRTGTKLYTDELRERFPSIWQTKISHYPPIHPIEVHRKQSEAKFVIVPSTWDVFNLTVVEAMSCGAVVICSSAAGAADMIDHGSNGFIFESGDAAALADLIMKVSNLDEAQLQSIQAAAVHTVKTRLSAQDVASMVKAEILDTVQSVHRSSAHRDSDLLASLMPSQPHGRSLAMAELNRLPLHSLIAYCKQRLLSKLLSKA